MAAYGDNWIYWRLARHPRTGAEYALGSLSRGGFGLIEAGTWRFRQVRPERPFSCAWAITQAPNGDIYQYDNNGLAVWDWQSPQARIVCGQKFDQVFAIDVAPDGRVYLPEYEPNRLRRFDPATGQHESLGEFHEFGKNIRDVYCDPNGLVYLNCYTHRLDGCEIVVVEFDPRTNQKRRVEAMPAAAPTLRLPLSFRDGSELVGCDPIGNTLTRKDADGRETTFTVPLEGSPLRIFSVEPGGDSIWGGTFIPLTLFRFTPSTGRFTPYGNPTKTNGEIYSMVFSRGNLYLASYVGAHLTRFDPSTGRPTPLGQMKEDGLPIHRAYGRALGSDGMVYFCAMGGYGCPDSGLCRIDPATDQVTRWIYPNTTFFAMTWVQATGQLLVSERRDGESVPRFTFLSPADGAIVWSEPVIHHDGGVVSWLDGGGDVVFGLHAHRATLFAFSLSQKKIVAELSEMRVGDHCYNALTRGLDGRIWGLTARGIYAVTEDLRDLEIIAELPRDADPNLYRFGLCHGPDDAVYFSSGTHLYRVRADAS